MSGFKKYKALLKDHRQPYFVVDFFTDYVLYCNDAMKKLLFGVYDVIGLPYYHVMSQGEDPVKPTLNWEEENIILQELHVPSLEKHFQVSYTTVKEGEEAFLLIQYTFVESEAEKPFHFKMAKHLAHLHLDPDQRIKALLQLLGQCYQGACAYVHILHHENKTIRLRNNWLNPSITDTSSYLVKDIDDVAGFQGLLLWAKVRNSDCLWDCDISRENSLQQGMDKLALTLFGRKNLILCGIENPKGELQVVISIGDCETLAINHALLKYVRTLIGEILKENPTKEPEPEKTEKKVLENNDDSSTESDVSPQNS